MVYNSTFISSTTRWIMEAVSTFTGLTIWNPCSTFTGLAIRNSSNVGEERSARNTIESGVKGVLIHITKELLKTHFNITELGRPFTLSQDGAIESDTYYHPTTAAQYVGLEESCLHIWARLLCYLYSFIVMPRASGHNKIGASTYTLHTRCKAALEK
ncbi:unnamed protein product [Cuscuta europaea]|uniref:Uncharacterized protein n=1 Tax=Cuscuta europaea TaxID=41803 RepID=A0A9P1A230_CUSEU|nr:unnamed protein product [Cuscuta europaea]